MARAVRPAKVKRKKIRIYKGEQRGDIDISGGVAKIRLTPKVILLFVLMVCAAISVVIVAVQQGSKQPLPSASVPLLQENRETSVPSTTQVSENRGLVISSMELIPTVVTAAVPIELKYVVSNPGAGEITYSIRWYVNNNPVQEGPSATLPPGTFHKGSEVHAELTANDSSGKSATLTTSSLTVVNSPPQLSAVTLDPKEPQRGAELTATTAATDADNDQLTCEYQWLVNGAPAGLAGLQNTFSTANLRKQDIVTVSVTCSDGQDATQPVVSSPASFGNSNPEIVSTAPDSVVSGVYAYQVVAKDPDGDSLRYRMERGPAGMTIDAASGLIQWTVPKGIMYTGRNEIQVKFTVDDANGGTASQEFVIVLIDYVNY